MNQISPADEKRFKLTLLIAIALLIVGPIIYLLVANFNTKDYFEAQESAKLIMYLLIPIAIVGPLLWLLIKRVQLSLYKRKAEETSMSKMYLSLMNIKLAQVAAIFVYGLVVFFLTNEIMNMSWFYLIGIVWSIIYWPRRSHFERVMNDGLEAI